MTVLKKPLIKKPVVKLVKKLPVKNIEGLEQGEPAKFPYGGTWHPLKTKSIKNTAFTVAGMMTGCGIAQMHGVVQLCDNKGITKEDLLNSLKDIKSDGVGGIIATLGAGYYNREPDLLKLGFELLSEYANYRHGSDGRYQQKCYMLKL